MGRRLLGLPGILALGALRADIFTAKDCDARTWSEYLFPGEWLGIDREGIARDIFAGSVRAKTVLFRRGLASSAGAGFPPSFSGLLFCATHIRNFLLMSVAPLRLNARSAPASLSKVTQAILRLRPVLRLRGRAMFWMAPQPFSMKKLARSSFVTWYLRDLTKMVFLRSLALESLLFPPPLDVLSVQESVWGAPSVVVPAARDALARRAGDWVLLVLMVFGAELAVGLPLAACVVFAVWAAAVALPGIWLVFAMTLLLATGARRGVGWACCWCVDSALTGKMGVVF